jgi:hypothetical protein
MGFRILLVACAAGVLLAGNAWSATPDPALSTVPNVVVEPGGSLAYRVTVVSVNGPVPGAIVRLHLTSEGDGLLGWCTSQGHPDIDATTNGSGVATFNVAGGGCLNPAALSAPPVQVFANGVLLRQVGIVSGDAVDDSGKLPTQGWNPGVNLKVALSDAVFHTAPLKTGAYNFCTDINSDGACNLTDAVILTPPIKTGHTCTHAP